MSSLTHSFLKLFTGPGTLEALNSGSNILKMKGIVLELTILKAARQFVFFLWAMIFFGLLGIQGCVLLVFHILNQLETQGSAYFDTYILFALILMTFSSIGFWVSLNQKLWLKAFGITKKIHELQHSPLDAEEERNEEDVDEKRSMRTRTKKNYTEKGIKDLTEMIEKIVDDKVEQKILYLNNRA